MSEPTSAHDAVSRTKLMAIVVLYKRSARESTTCESLRIQQAGIESQVSCLLYDNSPDPVNTDGFEHWLHAEDPANGGLSKAYNYALKLAKERGCEWLLLLDQDSTLPPGFVVNLLANIESVRPRSEIAAIVPRIVSSGRQVSPMRVLPGREVPYDGYNSVTSGWISAINSAAAVRVSFLEAIGGFSNDFWLDYLDYWLFRKLYESGKRIFVTDDCVQHDLSVVNVKHSVSPERFRNILAAEMRFTNEYLSLGWRVALAIRLLARTAKHLLLRNKKLAQPCLRAAFVQTQSELARWIHL